MSRKYRDLGRMLREIRLGRDLTQSEVAAALGADSHCDDRTIRRYESGECRPPRTTLMSIAAKALSETDSRSVNRLLRLAKYAALTPEEMTRYKLGRRRTHGLNRGLIPQIMAVSNIYLHPNGRFQKEGTVWKEHRRDNPKPFTFKELRVDHEYVYLYDETRRRDPGRPMYLRIPIEGGVAQWTFPNPLRWEDLMVVEPQWEGDAA